MLTELRLADDLITKREADHKGRPHNWASDACRPTMGKRCLPSYKPPYGDGEAGACTMIVPVMLG
jgi:hypothetical protein